VGVLYTSWPAVRVLMASEKKKNCSDTHGPTLGDRGTTYTVDHMIRRYLYYIKTLYIHLEWTKLEKLLARVR